MSMSPIQQMIQQRYARAQTAFDAVDASIREGLVEALAWAIETLRDHEGAGHTFELSYNQARGDRPEGFVASFAKPQWNADHSSQPMPSAQEAIVMAVCEYLNGC